jgi:signal peptidase II
MRTLFLSALIVLLIDQSTKLWILFGLRLEEVGGIDIFPPLLVFRFAWNTGVNFGLFSAGDPLVRWGLVLLSFLISWAIVRYARSKLANWRNMVLAGIIVGGAMGNVVDRVLYGAVVDFLNMSCCGINNHYVFNFADVAIFAGAIGLALLAQRFENTA